MQMLAEYTRRGQVDLATLGEIGDWYQEKYQMTAPVGVVAVKDPAKAERQSFWYNSKQYRVNFILEESNLLLRDLHVFSDNYLERYLDKQCSTANMTADALPVIEGFLWINELANPNLRLEVFEDDTWRSPVISTVKNNKQLVVNAELIDYSWIFEEDKLECKVKSNKKWRLLMPCHDRVFTGINRNNLSFTYEGFNYEISIIGAKNIIRREQNLVIEPEADNIILKM